MPHADAEQRKAYHRAYEKRRGESDPQYHIKNNNRWRKNNPKGYMLSRVKCRARDEGIPFDLTVDDFEIPEFCPVFPYIKLEFSTGKGRPDNIPTLDRVIPELGYVKGNVRVISMRANRLKSDASVEELRAIIDYINAHLGQDG